MRAIKWLSDLLKKGGGLCLLGMMSLTCADVIGGLFGYPILGSEELVTLMGAVLLAFALPSTHIEKGHIGVDLLYNALPHRVKIVNNRAVTFVSSIFFLLVSWQCYLYAKEMKRVGQVSLTIKFPTFYVIYGISLACLVLAIVIFTELFRKSIGDAE